MNEQIEVSQTKTWRERLFYPGLVVAIGGVVVALANVNNAEVLGYGSAGFAVGVTTAAFADYGDRPKKGTDVPSISTLNVPNDIL